MEKPLSSKTPLVQQPSREEELVGGIKNGLERGEPMPKIKQSFINAGYKIEEVENAVRKVSPQNQIQQITQTPQQTTPPPTPSTPFQKAPGLGVQSLPNP